MSACLSVRLCVVAGVCMCKTASPCIQPIKDTERLANSLVVKARSGFNCHMAKN